MTHKKVTLFAILHRILGLPPVKSLVPVRVVSTESIIRSRIMMMRDGRMDRS